ncbi:MAG: UpxY family transcription antiterminator [Alistipes sp.]|nr:UpxY family transcription antiterminator [Alistipes sp.]
MFNSQQSIDVNSHLESENKTLEWYVMRVTYQRELIAKRRFDELGIVSFVPTRLNRTRLSSGINKLQRKALVHNYIFVFSDRDTLDAIKQFELPYLRYVMHVQDSVRQVMKVPLEQMRSFMLVTGTEDERLMLLAPDSVDLRLGTRVRVIGGLFAGAEGVLIKVAGARERRVVVKIEGVTAVATPKIDRELLEEIK